MIFILGGHGFVGSAYARRLELAGRPHVVLSRQNYRDYVGRSCDLFINANGNSRKLLAAREPLEDFDASVRSVRSSLVDFRFEKYVFLSTVDVYPDCSSPQTTGEDSPLDLARQSPYGFHKYLAEQCVRHAARRWLIVRLGGFVGPELKKNAIFDVLEGDRLWLDPASALQFIHTDAAAEMVLRLAEMPRENEVFNLCGQGTIALEEVRCASGRDVAVQRDAPRVRYEVAIDKLSQLVDVPATRQTVLDFVAEHQRTVGGRVCAATPAR